MRASVLRIGLLLFGVGLAVFLWKTVVLGLPLQPAQAEHLWGVELEVTARGIGRPGSVRAVLPAPDAGAMLFDERSASGGLAFQIRRREGERVGVWSGRYAGTQRLVHGFRVELPERLHPLPDEASPPAAGERLAELASTAVYPARARDVEEILASLSLPSARDVPGRVRRLLAFVSEEVAVTPEGSDDALLTLDTREGSPAGAVRLLVTLLRAAGVPARSVLGLALSADRPPRTVLWAEAWVGERWVPAFPTQGHVGRIPADHLALGHDRLVPVDSTGVEALSWRYRALREPLRSDEVAAMMTADRPVLSRLSLYALPFGTQRVLRLLLLLPLGALVTALYRNLVGVPTFGTFMPVLIALALRESSLTLGLLVIVGVLGFGIGGRLLLERLHLLLVPRLGILLSLVVLTVTGFALLGRGFQSRDLEWGVLLPIVILTMLVERVSVSLAEEGTRNTLVKSFWSVVVALSAYPVFKSMAAQHLFFGYPELVLCTMGVLVWIGGYTGYRLSELIRFRTLTGAGAEGT